ncbi:MAG TPA: glycosyltransferase family 39 protein, partial [Candidatus Methanoperedens sp.]
MNILSYWIYIIVVSAISFVPGLAITGRLKKLDILEKLAISFGFSFIVIALMVPFLAFKLDYPARLFIAGIIVVSLFSLLMNREGLKFDPESRFLLFVLVAGFVSRFFLQTQWEYPAMGGDWFGHAFVWPYRFETGDWMPERDRTPLFGLLIYAYHNILGTSLYQYWISQIIGVVLNSVFILPAFLIARKVFGDRVAKASALFMIITPFLVFNSLYTWPKNAAMYGILMMIYFLFFSDLDIKLRYPLAGFFAGLGFWFHNYAVFYIGIAVLLLLFKENMFRSTQRIYDDIKKLSYFFLVLFIVLAPYFAWVYSFYGTFSTSKFIYYPFAINGYESAFLENKQEFFKIFYSTPLREIIMVRISNAAVTLAPLAVPINPQVAGLHTYNPVFYYSHDYPGALSTLMYLVIITVFLRYFLGKIKINSVLSYFVILPILIHLVLYGWKEWGLLSGGLHPTIPILIIIGFNELYRSFNTFNVRRLILLVFITAVIDNIIFFYLIKKLYFLEGGIKEVGNSLHQIVPSADVSQFISAYFFLRNGMDPVINL